jgi:hypothetical protein
VIIICAHPVVSYVLPYCIHVPEGRYFIRFNRGQYYLKNIFLEGGKRPDGSVISGPAVEIFNDVFGRAGSSKFTIYFLDINITNKQIPLQEVMHYLKVALEVGNRFLSVCRDQDVNSSGIPSFHIIPVTVNDVTMKEIGLADENFNEIPKTNSIMPLPGEVAVGPEAVQRSKEVMDSIVYMLENDISIPVWRILIRSAQNHLWRAEYRIVPVEANTAFEGVIIHELHHYLQLAGLCKNIYESNLLSRIEMLQKYSNKVRINKGKEPIEWVNTKDGWKKLSGVNEIIDWYNKCYLLRNRIIHESVVNISGLEAKESLNSTIKAINFIKGLSRI